MKTVVIVTGGFDPLHSGHIKYFKCAKKLGNVLVVGINSDAWLQRKKKGFLLPFKERKCIVENLKMVDNVINFNDKDNSAKDAIIKVKRKYKNYKIIFANGGDRSQRNSNSVETSIKGVKYLWGIGGSNKINSSSRILKKYITRAFF